MDTSYSSLNREHAYEKIEKKILCEKYLEQNGQSNGLTDYKFYCFNGKARFLYISKGLENHETATVSFYDLEMNLLPFRREDYKANSSKEEIPKNWCEMIKIANKLSSGFAFVRIDLYSINNNIYFSEYTFTPCAGFMKFDPPKYDYIVGEMLDLSVQSKGIDY